MHVDTNIKGSDARNTGGHRCKMEPHMNIHVNLHARLSASICINILCSANTSTTVKVNINIRSIGPYELGQGKSDRRDEAATYSPQD